MNPSYPRLSLLFLFSAMSPLLTPVYAYEGRGADGVGYTVQYSPEALSVTWKSPRVNASSSQVCLAVGNREMGGSFITPYAKDTEGSTVFLPFRAGLLVYATADGSNTRFRRWNQTQWSAPQSGNDTVRVQRGEGTLTLVLPRSLIGKSEGLRVTAYAKDFSSPPGWGTLFGALGTGHTGGSGDVVLRHFLALEGKDGALTLRSRGDTDAAKVRIYQMLPRHFGNTNETRKPNGFIEDNGSGKFADLNPDSLASLKKTGFTHIWATGVLQQATATDYSAIGEPADDPDLLKGLAGSPYAIKDYFDVCPDYARDPAKRLEEFKAMVSRVHASGLKVLIDFVPNHVARSYHSTIKPDLDFGSKDDRTKFFSPDNNFFWLTPECNPTGKGPPLRLPTVDAQGRPTSPTCKVAKTPSDGLFAGERDAGRVTGNNVASWEPDAGSWYETVKLNYGFDFTDPAKKRRTYPHGDQSALPIPDTWNKMDAVIAYWQEMGVDGFRVDMAHMVPPEFWSWMITRARSRNPGVYFVAEAYDSDPAKVPGGDPVVREAGGGHVMVDLLNAGFDAVYDDATYDKLKDIYDGGAWANDLDRIHLAPFVADQSLRYAENHDEVRLAGKGHWGGIGMEAGRPVSAILYGLSRGPIMLYSGQEVGEPADGAEGFGGDDARTSIFDYWSMPEFAKWVNGGKFDGGRLSAAQKDLREFYGRLVRLANEPAFRDGDFYPLNPDNEPNPAYGRLGDEKASGHWLYGYLRRDQATGQAFLVLANLHRSETLRDVAVVFTPQASMFLGKPLAGLAFEEKLSSTPPLRLVAAGKELVVPTLPPLTPYYFEIKSAASGPALK
ncbi:MAG: alpha-amylase family glycosyl hydrolase [Candidatus Methylacidiphilales bacterium]|nr:alpha-amylase family glycosyl hydrolase [Candidatus Methylacidiphilales bacterium]